jgi:PAS domain S-box-containing protein
MASDADALPRLALPGEYAVGSQSSPRRRALTALFGLPPKSLLPGVTIMSLAYYATAQLGHALSLPGASVSALWFPNAVVLAALLLTARRFWWVCLLAVLPVHLLAQVPLADVSLRQISIQYVMNCSTALIAALAFLHFMTETSRFDQVRSTLLLVLFGGVLAPLSTSVVMAAAFLAFDVNDTFWLTASARALTNTFAILTLVPLVVHGADWLRSKHLEFRWQRTTEVCLMLLCVIGSGLIAFVLPRGSVGANAALLSVPLPALLWAAVRFGVVGISSSAILLGTLATWAAFGRHGPHSPSAIVQNTLSVVLFLVMTYVPLLLLATALEERRKLERARTSSDARFRSIFDHHIAPTVIWRDEGVVTDANSAFLQLTGYTTADLRTGNVRVDHLAPGASGWGVDRRIDGQNAKDAASPEQQLVLRDGRTIPALAGGCRFPGEMREGAAYAIDLSGWRQAEVARREAEALHGAVLASIHDQIVVLDQNGIIIEANASWRLSEEHSAAQPFSAWKVGQDFHQQCDRASAAGDEVAGNLARCLREVLSGREARHQLEYATPTAHGVTWFEVTMERLRHLDGGAVVSWTDITDRKQVAAQARAQHEQLAHLGRAAVLGELSGAFAHELSQPLTSILGNAEAAQQLLQTSGIDPQEIQPMLSDIIAADVRASEVIRRLRSMLTRGEIERRPVDLNSTIKEVLDLARGDLMARQVTVELRLDVQAPAITGDRIQLQQVILNLIVNACEAMSTIDISRRQLNISTRFAGDTCMMTCSFRDHGCGIPGDNIEHIFQPFVTTKPAGLGMGLAICRSIIESHGGKLWAENAADGGAIFSFSAAMSG